MTEEQNTVRLTNRKIIKVTGEDATHFLQLLITTDVEKINPRELFPGALLSPQGKIIFDFLISTIDQGYMIDISACLADAFQKRLSLYKLRKNVEITKPLHEVITVFWNNKKDISDFNLSFADKRFPDTEHVVRTYGTTPFSTSESHANWDLMRIRHAIAESGQDYEIGTVFPHDVNYDQIHGLVFDKGCYIGQEVISRIHHRNMARRRCLIIKGQQDLTPESDLKAGERTLAQLRTCVKNEALALVRVDHIENALNTGVPFTVNNSLVTIEIAKNMKFSFPQKP